MPPRRSATHAPAAIATPCNSAAPTSVAQGAPPVIAESGARSQNSAGPGWLQPRLYGPTSGLSPVNTSRTLRVMLVASCTGK